MEDEPGEGELFDSVMEATDEEESASPGLGLWLGDVRRVDSRFEGISPAGRDALRTFLSSTRNVGEITEDHEALLKALPIFRVHTGKVGGSDSGVSRREVAKFTSISGAEKLFLAPKHTDPALLGPEFAMEKNANDTELLQTLGVERISKATFFREHVLPRAVARRVPEGSYSSEIIFFNIYIRRFLY